VSKTKSKDQKSKPMKWRKRVIWVMVLLPIILVLAVFITGQTPITKILVLPILERELGIDVDARSVRLLSGGDLILNDVICSSDEIDSRAGSLLEFDKALIKMNWLGVIRGSNQIESITIDRPLVRMSQDVDTGVLNLALLKPKGGSGGGATPMIVIRDGVYQIGEHDSNGYRLLKELSIQGRIEEQNADGISAFDFLAQRTDPVASSPTSTRALNDRGVISFRGEISEDGVGGVIDGIRLQDWPADIVPSRSREVYERLGLSGELAPTRFTISQDGQIEIVLILDGVGVNLPFEESGLTNTISSKIDDPLRMRNTRGIIRFGSQGIKADLNGVIDDLDYDVHINYAGLETTSAFDAVLKTSFRLDDRFKPARFLPERVISKINKFEHPVADIEAEVFISRSDDPNDQQIDVSGRADISNGSAMYGKFRYPVYDLHGSIQFDSEKLIINEVVGTGPTGAMVRAEGLFSPLGEQSVANLKIDVQGVALDEHLKRAFDDDQRELFNALCSTQDYNNLLDEQLILTPDVENELQVVRKQIWERLNSWQDGIDGSAEQRRLMATELASIERQLLTPIFDFAGTADISVELNRFPDRPEDKRWTTDVHVKIDQIGIVPKHFPLPIIAHDIEIMIDDQGVELTGGEYIGLTGGRAEVDVKLDLAESNAKPTIHIRASEIEIDDRLIAAIPGYYDEQSGDQDSISLRRILDRLRLSGKMECDALIGPRSDGRLGYDVESTIINGSARPVQIVGIEQDSFDPLALDEILGTVYVTEELIIVDLDGMVSSPEQPLAPTPIQVLTQLTLPSKRRGIGGIRRSDGLLPTDFGPPVPGAQLYATASADRVDLAMPLEHLIAVVSPRVARQTMDVVSESKIDGVIAMDAQIDGFVGGAIKTSLSLDRLDSLGFQVDETRYQLDSSWGRAQIILKSEPEVHFEDFRVAIKTGGREGGMLSLNGQAPLARAGRTIEVAQPSKLDIIYENGEFNSPITSNVIQRLSKTSKAGWVKDHQLGGLFDLSVSLSPSLGVHDIDGEDDAIRFVPTLINGTLKPKSITIVVNEEPVEFASVSGEVLFDGFEGSIENITAEDETSSLLIDGDWTLYPGKGLSLDLTVNAERDLLRGPIRAILPDTFDDVITRLAIDSQGPLLLNNMSILASGIGKPEAQYRIDGNAQLNNASAVIGLPITEIYADLDFAFSGDTESIGYEILFDASRMRVGLMRAYDADFAIIGDADNPGVVLIPDISAGMHGGQIAGTAQIRPEADGVPHYWMELHASGVRAAPVFDDLLLPPEGLYGPPREGEEFVLSTWSKSEDLSRGAMIGDLTITGPIGNASKQSGRGLVRISGGSVVALPGLINLIEASNLSWPVGSTIDLAEASFYVDGQTLAFEQLSASSENVEILGYGTMDWLSRDVDLRFRSRSVNPIPFISDFVQQLRDELITTRVSGKMGNTKYSVEQFSATKRLFNAMLGNPLTNQQRRLYEVEQQVDASRFKSQRNKDADHVHLPIRSLEDSWDWDREERAEVIEDQ
jgi:hypothetical protein